jgi:hypothetical protein
MNVYQRLAVSTPTVDLEKFQNLLWNIINSDNVATKSNAKPVVTSDNPNDLPKLISKDQSIYNEIFDSHDEYNNRDIILCSIGLFIMMSVTYSFVLGCVPNPSLTVSLCLVAVAVIVALSYFFWWH